MKSVYKYNKTGVTKNCVKYQIGECVEGAPVLLDTAHHTAYILKSKILIDEAAPDQVTLTIEY
jgi:hypothetical protein